MPGSSRIVGREGLDRTSGRFAARSRRSPSSSAGWWRNSGRKRSIFSAAARSARASPDSDCDLAIVLKDDWNVDPLDDDAAYEPLLGLGVGCDVVPYPLSIFEAEQEIEGTIAFAATHRGRLLYRAPR